MAISCARKFFLAVIGNQAPALTVASLATITHLFSATCAITTTTPAAGQPPCSSYIFSAAKIPTSKTSFGLSTNWFIRSRAESFPCSFNFFKRAFPPPNFILRIRSCSSAQAIFKASLLISSSKFIFFLYEIRKY